MIIDSIEHLMLVKLGINMQIITTKNLKHRTQNISYFILSFNNSTDYTDVIWGVKSSKDYIMP